MTNFKEFMDSLNMPNHEKNIYPFTKELVKDFAALFTQGDQKAAIAELNSQQYMPPAEEVGVIGCFCGMNFSLIVMLGIIMSFPDVKLTGKNIDSYA